MRARTRWAATFDGANCKLFAVHGRPARLEALDLGVAPGSHKPEFEDKPGKVYSSVGPGRSGMTPRTDAERALEASFVERVAAALEAKAKAGAFDDLIILAEPRALGAFRDVASPALAKKVIREISGNYVTQSEQSLAAAIDGD